MPRLRLCWRCCAPVDGSGSGVVWLSAGMSSRVMAGRRYTANDRCHSRSASQPTTDVATTNVRLFTAELMPSCFTR